MSRERQYCSLSQPLQQLMSRECQYCSLSQLDSLYMSRIANNALLGGGIRVRVWIREQRKIKGRSKALLSLCWQSWTSLKWWCVPSPIHWVCWWIYKWWSHFLWRVSPQGKKLHGYKNLVRKSTSSWTHLVLFFEALFPWYARSNSVIVINEEVYTMIHFLR